MRIIAHLAPRNNCTELGRIRRFGFRSRWRTSCCRRASARALRGSSATRRASTSARWSP